jgi:hypothetical protein
LASVAHAGGSHELNSVLIPLAVVFLLSYTVASMFLSVYQLTIETILICFCEDREKHKGTRVRPTAFEATRRTLAFKQ